ncbi:ubiquitin carboxyl-terminal hydrolase 5/13 [Pancytospora philotis]|nr:ubiquitin carboxyl-terminal hydrolase 5/13 [Pancytospora philotis]
MDLSGFRGECCYCFRKMADGLVLCGCNLSVCLDHCAEHGSKFDCPTLFHVRQGEDGAIVVSKINEGLLGNGAPDAVKADLEQRIHTALNTTVDADALDCKHVRSLVPVETELVSPRCSECGLTENLWVCLCCGHVGCGRKQVGKNGNEHALRHYENTKDMPASSHAAGSEHKARGTANDAPSSSESGGDCKRVKQCKADSSAQRDPHGLVAYVSSLGGDRAPEVYCYCCDEFVKNPPQLKIRYQNASAEAFQQPAAESSDTDAFVRESNAFIGIKNAGQTCYISSALQLLGSILKDTDLTIHFSLCEESPLDCLCCQFVKVMEALRNAESNGSPSKNPAAPSSSPPVPAALQAASENFLNVEGLLNIVYKEMPQYPKGMQQDSADFLQTLLYKLALFEESMLLPPISDSFKFTVQTALQCESCGDSSVNESEDKLLYVNYASTLQDALVGYFAPFQNKCSCGSERTGSTSIQSVSRYLLVCVKKYKYNGSELSKITEPIDAAGASITDSGAFRTTGAIVHTGPSMNCGHYTFWVDAGDRQYSINDVSVKASTKDALKDGVIFKLEK